MGEKTWFWYTILGIIYLAILTLLVRPGSPATQGVISLSNGLSSLIKTAVGGNPATNIIPGTTLT